MNGPAEGETVDSFWKRSGGECSPLPQLLLGHERVEKGVAEHLVGIVGIEGGQG